MKHILSFLFTCLSITALSAQATLPASWNMDNATTPPTGWSYDLLRVTGNITYTGNGFFSSGPQSLRLDGTGEYLQVFFAGRADTVEYWLRTSSGNDTGLIFTVQESTNGSNWTTARQYNRNVPQSGARHMTRLKPESRYLRFTLTRKITGFNIALDDVLIKPAASGGAPEIQAFANNTLLASGQTLRTGASPLYPLKVKNKGNSQSLIVDSVRFTGPSASFLKLGGLPDTILPGGEKNVLLQVLGAPAGSVKATMLIYSNDSAGNNPYRLNIYGISGDLPDEPTQQASLNFTTTRAWQLRVNAGSGNGDNVLVLISTDSITAEPADGSVYVKGAYIGNARIAHNGAATNVRLDQIVANTTYWVRAFPWNGYDTFTNYRQSGAIQVKTTTPGLNAGAYYDGINPATGGFVQTLRAKVRPHFQIFYSNYGTTMVDEFAAYDTTGGKRVLTCTYSGYKHVFSPPIIWDTMSREHSYPYSWMGESSKDSANYSDLHVLFPVHQLNANAVRSNFPYNNLKKVTFQFLAGKLGEDSSGNLAYEPPDAVKGMVARASFYMCATYHSSAKPFTLPTSVPFINYLQDQRVLKRWHNQFPPSKYEIARQEYVAFKQNNRNPFIDNPSWACYIDFRNMGHVPSGDCSQFNSIDPLRKTLQISAFPVPAADRLNVDLSAFGGKECKLMVMDVLGNMVLETTTGSSSHSIDVSGLAPGMYLLYAQTTEAHAAVKFIR